MTFRPQQRFELTGLPKSCRSRPSARVKGCPTPAGVRWGVQARWGLGAGVGQASREETAGTCWYRSAESRIYGDLDDGRRGQTNSG